MSRHLLIAVIALLLTACSTARGKREGYNWPYPEAPGPSSGSGSASSGGSEGFRREDRENPLEPAPGESSTVAIAPPVKPLPNVPKTFEEISSPPVASLMRKARDARAAGKPDQAQLELGNALRIESRNYFAWSAMAATHLDKKDYEQAVSAASKSNSLARGNIYVELENYRIIQQAREALGDAAGALTAQLRADEIQAWMAQAAPQSITP